MLNPSGIQKILNNIEYSRVLFFFPHCCGQKRSHLGRKVDGAIYVAPWWQKGEAAGHMASTVRTDAVLSSHSPLYLDQDLGTWKNAAHIQSMFPHLNLSGNTL